MLSLGHYEVCLTYVLDHHKRQNSKDLILVEEKI